MAADASSLVALMARQKFPESGKKFLIREKFSRIWKKIPDSGKFRSNGRLNARTFRHVETLPISGEASLPVRCLTAPKNYRPNLAGRSGRSSIARWCACAASAPMSRAKQDDL